MSVQLYTIPFSHYCELGRWALQAAGVRFTEYGYLPATCGQLLIEKPVFDMHVTRTYTTHRSFISATLARCLYEYDACYLVWSYIGHVDQKKCIHGMHSLVVGRIRKAAGMKGSGTPLLLNDNGEIIGSDSFACARHLGVLDESLVTILDTDVGPRTRSIAYSHLLKPGEGQSTLDAACFAAPQVSWWQRAVWSVGFLRRKVYEMMHGGMVRNDEYIEKCRERLRSALIKIEPLLSEPDFALPTNGDSKEQVVPTVSGIAVASLMYPVIWPPEVEAAVYGDAPHPTYEDMPQAMRDEIEQWRATPVGRWTLAYYAAYRLPSLEKARAVL